MKSKYKTIRDLREVTNLLKSASKARYGVVKEMIEKDPSLISQRNTNGQTVLHKAAESKDYKLVEWLLDQGADVNEQDNGGAFPIHCAQGHGVVTVLIEAGAKINAQDNDGDTALHGSMYETASRLVELGIDVNRKNNEGMNILHIICDCFEEFDTKELLNEVQKLVDLYLDNPKQERRVKVNAKDQLGATPLFYAVHSGSDYLVEALVDHGAKVNAADKERYTPLLIAVMRKDESLVRYLLSKGANPKARHYRKTAKRKKDLGSIIEYAETHGYNRILALLKEA